MNRYVLPADTSEEARRVQFDSLRAMDISGRGAMTFRLNRAVREVARAGIRSRHPDYSEAQVQMALMRLTLGEKLFLEVFPDSTITP
jgi:hypothetical protein